MQTSNKNEKVVMIYNYHFFITMYHFMEERGYEQVFDSVNTLWHIDDVTQILMQGEKHAK